jgi:hypothetical protein
MKIGVLLGAALILSSCSATRSDSVAGNTAATFAFTNVNVVDVQSGTVARGETVIVRGDRIATVSSHGHSLPTGTTTIDATGKYLIPGLWDSYTFALDGVANGEPVLELLVAHGVTGIRDMGSEMALEEQRRVRDSIQQGQRIGPRILYAGRRLTSPTVRTSAATAVVTNERDTAAVIASLKEAGAEVVVGASSLTADLHRTVAAEARKQEMSSSTWVVSGWIDAAETGFQAIDHPADLNRSTSLHRQEYFDFYAQHQLTPLPPRSEADPLFARMVDTPDRDYYMQTIQAVARNRVYVVTNLGSWYFARRDWEFKDPSRAVFHTDAATAEMAAGEKEGTYQARAGQRILESLGDLHRAGVKVLPGTNASEVGRETPGLTLHDELHRFVLSGMTPAETLRAATLDAATFLGRADQVGSIAEGKLADLVLLDANPLADIGNTMRIQAVVVNGRLYRREELDQLIEDAAAFVAKKNRAATR